MNTPPALLLKVAVFTVTVLFGQPSAAQLSAVQGGYISALSPNSHENPLPDSNPILSTRKITTDSLSGLSSSREHQRLLNYLKDLGIPDQQYKYPSNKKFYYHLANVFARLRLYPLAMKCFFKAVRNNGVDADSSNLSAVALDNPLYGSFSLSSKDDSIVGKRVLVLKTKPRGIKSKRTNFIRSVVILMMAKLLWLTPCFSMLSNPLPGNGKYSFG